MEEFPQLAAKHYHELQHELRSGDILLCSGNSIFATLIRSVTRSVWSHVAFILRVEPINRIMVLESVESIGVRAIPLTSYVRDYNGSGKSYPGRLMIARHNGVKEENIPKLSKKAVDLLGYPYRQEEIIHIAARLSMHAMGIINAEPDKKGKRAYICSEYAQTCFESIGVSFNYNALGFIAPADFAMHPKVKPLYFLKTDNQMQSDKTPLHTIADAVTLTA